MRPMYAGVAPGVTSSAVSVPGTQSGVVLRAMAWSLVVPVSRGSVACVAFGSGKLLFLRPPTRPFFGGRRKVAVDSGFPFVCMISANN